MARKDLNFEPEEPRPEKEAEELRAYYKSLSLQEFIPAISPHFSAPYHLKEMTDAIEDAVFGRSTRARYAITVPVRHGKSETIAHAIPWILLQDPSKDIVYTAYGATHAQTFSRLSRDLWLLCGGKIKKDHNTIAQWRTEEGGRVIFTGVDGDVAGKGAHYAFFDDPIKGREEANSLQQRNKATNFMGMLISRLHQGGAAFLVSCRWHIDDPIGEMVKKGTYTYIHRPAIIDEGLPTERALWPEVRSIEDLKALRAGDISSYDWASWYQGEPRPPDSNLFQSAAMVYDRVPESHQIAIGVDLGFTEFGDQSAIVVMARDDHGIHYILRVEKCSKSIQEVTRVLKATIQTYPTAQLFQYVSGPESGTLDLLREPPHGIDICGMPARYNKYARAMPTADKWNQGKIRVPKLASWDLAGFVAQCLNFTGLDGDRDDMVDAMVAAFDALDGGACSGLLPGFYGRRTF